MSFIQSLLKRRQFILVVLSSVVSAVISMVRWRTSNAIELIFRTGRATASETPAAGGKKPLRGIVAYYSGTGNTAQVADAVWRGMNSVIPCDVATVNKLNPKKMARYDIMALGAPNWYMRVPANVLVFTHDMPRMDGKHAFLFGTHGSGGPGMFWIMSKNILRKGMSIIGWSDWYGSDFLTPHSSVPDGEWGHPDSIDLAEAEAFGRQMALNSIRIYAGETGLLPDAIPTPEVGGNSLFSPSGGNGKPGFAGGAANGSPKFDFMKCVYPRCDRCIKNCPVQAIDFSVVAPGGFLKPDTITEHPVVLKEACVQCGGLCERVCTYGAISYVGDTGERVYQEIDMTKCTYPKCTACMDECPQEAIDVSKNPPIVYPWCENESLCYGVCPENAIAFTQTSMHINEGNGGRGELGTGDIPGEGFGMQGGGMPGGGMPGGGMPGGTGGGGMPEGMPEGMPGMPGGMEGGGGMPGGMGGYTVRFRNLLKDKEGLKGTVATLTQYPRIPIYKKIWPYHMDES